MKPEIDQIYYDSDDSQPLSGEHCQFFLPKPLTDQIVSGSTHALSNHDASH